MKKTDRFCISTILVMLLLLVCRPLPAQQTISGIVTGTEGAPLPGVTIAIQGSTVAVFSAADGRFAVVAQKGDVLVFSSVGREKTAVKIVDQHFLSVTLSTDVKSLDEVLLVGYGTARKKDVTGAVTKISAAD
ncbi:MAG TPA: carboxypeptidase-like regulatory domain-containing protein, partial [Flavisolibacter sp.]|nr:carboxypeptidase-like regulatory domain-containing protein [Flavisolibacter sp.]